MNSVRAKKSLGQHFLLDETVSQRIAALAAEPGSPNVIVEVGAGMGALTKYLFAEKKFQTFVVEIDRESVDYLVSHFPDKSKQIIPADFLNVDFDWMFRPFFADGIRSFSVIGNFPYNISSQILFKVLDHRDHVPLVVGMFQKEVAERIASRPKKKSYGILSVFMQTFYNVELLFDVPPESFRPVPKVVSAVLRLKRNNKGKLDCQEKTFFTLVKTGFNQRRKTLRNALKSILPPGFPNDHPALSQRAEELSSAEFEALALLIDKTLTLKPH